VDVLVRHLSQNMKKELWMSTQERVWGLLALGKFARMAGTSNATATVTIDNKVAGQFKDKDLVIMQKVPDKNIKVTASGSGSVYYFYELEGISATGAYKQEDNYISVRKNFYDRFGNLLSGNTFSQNDLVVVEINVKTTDGSYVENVAVTDILPACFEIENPRISPERDMPWIKNKAEPQYLDIRDDRISFFTSINEYQKNFYYMVRVVSTGKYKMGPVTADAMYNGEYHSAWGGRTVTVK
jgi:alpha-2-macroglobulin